MEDDKKTADSSGQPGQPGHSGDRKARLATELRDNLKRRKSQSRSRHETEPPGQRSRKDRKTLIDPA